MPLALFDERGTSQTFPYRVLQLAGRRSYRPAGSLSAVVQRDKNAAHAFQPCTASTSRVRHALNFQDALSQSLFSAPADGRGVHIDGFVAMAIVHNSKPHDTDNASLVRRADRMNASVNMPLSQDKA